MLLRILYYACSLLLECIYFLAFPFLYLCLDKTSRAGRLGLNPPPLPCDLLIHAASVGEINGIKPLLLSVLDSHPSYHILLTCNTVKGREAAQNLHPRLQVQIAPLDILHLRLAQIKAARPGLIIITETEIWPQFLWAASLCRIPVVYVNARISETFYRKLAAVSSFTRWLGKAIVTLYCQTEADTRRFYHLFAVPCIQTGNLKFSVSLPDYDMNNLRSQWGYKADDLILAIGSSRPGEEALLLVCYDKLLPEFPTLKLILAPRHLPRMKEIRTLLTGREVSYATGKVPAQAIHVLDVMGQLPAAYALSNVCLIGGSFEDFKGHNPLEAAFYSKPILMGPFFSSCRQSVNALLDKQAILISDKERLCADLRDVLAHPDAYAQYGTRAKQVLADNSSSLHLTLSSLNQFLP